MKIFYIRPDDSTVSIYIRMESENGDLAEGMQDLHAGESFLGVPFEEFVANETGVIELDEEGRLCKTN